MLGFWGFDLPVSVVSYPIELVVLVVCVVMVLSCVALRESMAVVLDEWACSNLTFGVVVVMVTRDEIGGISVRKAGVGLL